MADEAAFAQGFVFVNKRAALRSVALEAGVVSAHEGDAAPVQRLRHVGSAAFDWSAHVRIVAITTRDFALENGMMMRQLKLGADFEVTLEASLGVFARVDDSAFATARGNMQTARSMARFAARVLGVITRRLQSCVRSGAEVARNIFVAGLARFRSNECCAGNARRCKQGAIAFERSTGEQN